MRLCVAAITIVIIVITIIIEHQKHKAGRQPNFQWRGGGERRLASKLDPRHCAGRDLA
jgi:hypothetical protein